MSEGGKRVIIDKVFSFLGLYRFKGYCEFCPYFWIFFRVFVNLLLNLFLYKYL